eukprot:CAMPEP_0170310662 /NCGR_PEP_ID=MMETSP0116_2-20130129/55817_1 /TAXON_ID=400756 /ORGANISM="Durinskia baltica, Strain CSIRO CS-38" /LENGTH=78 /DNA_ID=CAMNT_0010562937 /DNA_START=36 /DNA_END=270 /DNA_ORIENTATION=+
MITSEGLQKAGNAMSLYGLLADLQQHRRLDLPAELSSLLEKKAKDISDLAKTVMKAWQTDVLLRAYDEPMPSLSPAQP